MEKIFERVGQLFEPHFNVFDFLIESISIFWIFSLKDNWLSQNHSIGNDPRSVHQFQLPCTTRKNIVWTAKVFISVI